MIWYKLRSLIWRREKVREEEPMWWWMVRMEWCALRIMGAKKYSWSLNWKRQGKGSFPQGLQKKQNYCRYLKIDFELLTFRIIKDEMYCFMQLSLCDFFKKKLKILLKISSFNFGHTFLMNIWILKMYGKIMTINYKFQSKNR